MGFSVWVDWRVLGGVLADVMSWVVCVCVCGVEWMWWVLSEDGERGEGRDG